jgi:Ca2+-transporting ATPase
MWITYNNKVLILLLFAALVSLVVGIPQSVRGMGVEWVEGATIIIVIIIIMTISAVND